MTEAFFSNTVTISGQIEFTKKSKPFTVAALPPEGAPPEAAPPEAAPAAQLPKGGP